MSTALSTDTSSVEPQVHVEFRRTLGHYAFEAFGILGAATCVGVLLWRSASAVGHAGDSVLMATFIVAILSGYVLADFASGVVHFLFDRFFSLETPLLGASFVAPFRMHHSDPKDITKHGFIETNGNNSLATMPFLLALIVLPFDYTSAWQLFIVVIITSAAVGTFLTNQFHKWAHSDHPPVVVMWLQDHHVILPRKHHQLHHSHPYDTHYCITTGWLNEILNRIGFWRALERAGVAIGLRLYTERTPWEQVPGSPAYAERKHMALTSGR